LYVHTIPGGNDLPGIFFHYFLLIRQTFYSFYSPVMIKYYAYSEKLRGLVCYGKKENGQFKVAAAQDHCVPHWSAHCGTGHRGFYFGLFYEKEREQVIPDAPQPGRLPHQGK
jgi:hypothetical protein